MITGAKPDPRLIGSIFEEEVVRNGNFAALDGIYTKDARILPPGAAMITGRAGIRAFWEQAVPAMGVVAVQLETIEMEPAGDSAVEIGRAVLTLTNGSTVEVKYVVVWKQEDGAWKWHIDIWNASA